MSEKRWIHSYPVGIKENNEFISEVTLVDLFERAVKESPNDTALVFEEDSYSYGELGNIVRRTASSLLEIGVKKIQELL